MEKQIITIILALSISTLIHTVDAQTCGDYGFYCESCSKVQVCLSNVPIGVGLTCPDGTYCDQTSTQICTTANCTDVSESSYECTTEGRFASASNCSQYFWCINESGTLVATLYSCPSTTVFNPDTSTCVLASSYSCDDVTSTESVTESTTTIIATTATIYETTTLTDEITTATDETTTTTDKSTITTDESTTVIHETTTSTDETTISTGETTATTDQTTTLTDENTTTSDETTTSIDGTTKTTDETTALTDENTTLSDNTITTTNESTTFEAAATTEAIITTTEISTTTAEIKTTTTSTTTTTTTEATFVCTSYGRFAVTSDTTCQSYYFCYPNSDGTYTPYVYVCPTTTVFNPNTSTCVAPTAYTCTN